MSDLDFKFLAASQELSRRETQKMLETIEKANHILLSARRKVKKESLKYRVWRGWTVISAFCITTPIILLRLTVGVTLALMYLKVKGVTLQQADKHQFQLGKARLIPFDGNDGGYVRANSGGYQMLLNFRGTIENFQTISLTDVFNNRIPANLMGDASGTAVPGRIVLIGAIAQSPNDLFYTPYSSSLFRTPKRMPGVVIHANLISQLVSAALDNRPLMCVWTKPQEWLWILGWSLMGAGFSWKLKSIPRIALGVFMAGSGLSAVAYLAFLQGWWLPVVPPMLGLVGGAIALPIVTNKRLEKLQLRRIFELLVEACRTSPAAGRIAIEYLKQSETENNQVLIQQWLMNYERLNSPPEDVLYSSLQVNEVHN